jgi:hypothetical protein
MESQKGPNVARQIGEDSETSMTKGTSNVSTFTKVMISTSNSITEVHVDILDGVEAAQSDLKEGINPQAVSIPLIQEPLTR